MGEGTARQVGGVPAAAAAGSSSSVCLHPLLQFSHDSSLIGAQEQGPIYGPALRHTHTAGPFMVEAWSTGAGGPPTPTTTHPDWWIPSHETDP